MSETHWLAFTVSLGYMQENVLGQKFEVDATLYCDLQSAGVYDDLQATTSYAEVFE